MKKSRKTILIAVLSAFFMVSCNKTNVSPRPENSNNINNTEYNLTKILLPQMDQDFSLSYNGDYLIFHTMEGYLKAVENPDSLTIQKLSARLNELNFRSLLSNDPDNPKVGNVEVEKFFASLVNPDMFIQIKDIVYRIDVEKEKVYATQATSIGDVRRLLMDEIQDPLVRVYETSDEVLKRIDEVGDVSAIRARCREDGAGSRAGNGAFINDLYDLQMQVRFYRYGIYFPAVFECWDNKYSNGNRTYIQLENIWYHVRCGNTVGPYSRSWESERNPRSGQAYFSYRGSRPLNGYHFKGRARLEDLRYPEGNNPYRVVFSPWVTIKVNSPY